MVRQSIRLILETEPGERVMRPTFGAGLRRYLMDPNTPVTRAQIALDVQAALATWEPRIVVQAVTVVPGDDPAEVVITVSYVHVRDQSPGSLELPLALAGAGGSALSGPHRGGRRSPLVSLPVPVLDDRTYDQLVAELTGRIAAYTPEWTDQGASDPGVTLLELFAFLGENLLFRFNQIPDATKLWLLRLLQVPPQPGRPAAGLVTLDPQVPSPAAPTQVDGGTLVRAGSMPFETLTDLVSLPVSARGLVKLAAAAPTDPELVAGVERAIDARGGLAADEAPPVLQRRDPAGRARGARCGLPLDVPDAVDGTLWIPVIAAGSLTAAQLLTPGGPLDGQVLNLGVALDDQPRPSTRWTPAGGSIPCAGPGRRRPPPADGVAGLDARHHHRRFGDGAAGVRAAERGGRHHRRAHHLRRGPHPAADRPDGGRCAVGRVPRRRSRPGRHRQPPPVLDDDPRWLFWLRAYPASGAPAIPALDWVGANAVDVDQMQTVGPEFVGHRQRASPARPSPGEPVGRPGQPGPAGGGAGGWVSWQQVETLAAAGPDDRVYVLDAAGARSPAATPCGATPSPTASASGP